MQDNMFDVYVDVTYVVDWVLTKQIADILFPLGAGGRLVLLR